MHRHPNMHGIQKSSLRGHEPGPADRRAGGPAGWRDGGPSNPKPHHLGRLAHPKAGPAGMASPNGLFCARKTTIKN